MLPVANVPSLHYVIEFLIMNKVTEIFITACKHTNQLNAFIKKQAYKGVKIEVVSPSENGVFESFGDILREINQLPTLNNDFILVRGDVITNANI